MRFVHFNLDGLRGDPRFSSFYTRANSAPSWVLRAALLAALAIIVIPFLLLALTAILAFTAVFLVLGLVHAISHAVRSTLGGQRADPARRNVRVIRVD